ncbi:MAG: hypothetical protein K2U26_13655, partial [Cyclobacteriaceae bacterium]|nr:hypothetical protein [Cyclobacteriaceae bacterium]
MRLGQLARKLEISTDKIVDFLASRQITIDPGANTRLEPDHEMLILQKFAPELLELPQEKIEEEIVEESVTPIAVAPEPASEPMETTPLTQQPDELPELIKAPKVELPGLKVIGKIELPEKKKKEPEPTPQPEPTEGAAPQKTFSENRRPQQYQKRPAPPPHK